MEMNQNVITSGFFRQSKFGSNDQNNFLTRWQLLQTPQSLNETLLEEIRFTVTEENKIE